MKMITDLPVEVRYSCSQSVLLVQPDLVQDHCNSTQKYKYESHLVVKNRFKFPYRTNK